jgi:peptide subunit release factor 1 (eRF1)
MKVSWRMLQPLFTPARQFGSGPQQESQVVTITPQVEAPPLRRAAPNAGATAPSLLERLVAIEPGPHRVVSCYVRLAPEDRRRRQYLTEVKQRSAASEQAAAGDLGRIADHLADARNLPAARGLAIFASEDLGLFEVIALPRVHRTRIVVDDTPWLRELVAADQDFGAVLVAVFDRSLARFFRATAFGATELAGLVEMSRRGGKFLADRRDSPGWGERDYHGRIREERYRHVEAIARHLETLMQAHHSRGILLAGPHKETAALARFAPPRLARCILGTANLNPTAVTSAQVQAAAFAVAAEHDQAEASALVASLGEAIGRRWGVNGPRETLRALARGQVRTLLVREDAELEGSRCSATGRLVLTKIECRGEGEPTPVHDLVDEALEEALRQRIQVVVLPASGPAAAVDGVAALLRFR